MPLQLYLMASIGLLGGLACWRDFEPMTKRLAVWCALGSCASGLIIGCAAMVLRNL